MKPSERSEAYIIGAVAILLTSLAFLPSSLLRWAGDPGDLRFIGWYGLTVLCLGGIGMILDWAGRSHKKFLLWLLTLPLAVIAYEVWFILKRLWVGVWADWKQIRHPNWFVLVLYLLMLYLWIRGSKYKEQAEKWKIQWEIACEALKKQQQLPQQMREEQGGRLVVDRIMRDPVPQQLREEQDGLRIPDEMKGLVVDRIMHDPALYERWKATDERGQNAILTEIRDQILKEQRAASVLERIRQIKGVQSAPTPATAAAQPIPAARSAEGPAGAPGNPYRAAVHTAERIYEEKAMAIPCGCTSEKCGHVNAEPCGKPTVNEPAICDECYKRNRPAKWTWDTFRDAIRKLWP
jgi:hypothetical protein